MGTMYVTQAGLLALQSAGLAGWTNPKCDLCSAVPTPPDFNAVIGDFTLAAFTGYTQSAATLTGGYVDQAVDMVFALTGLLKFAGPSSGAGETELGFVVQDGTSHTIWAWGTFSGPKPEEVSTDVIAFVIRLNEDTTSVVFEVV